MDRNTIAIGANVALVVMGQTGPLGARLNINPLAQELANVIGAWVARQQWGALVSQG